MKLSRETLLEAWRLGQSDAINLLGPSEDMLVLQNTHPARTINSSVLKRLQETHSIVDGDLSVQESLDKLAAGAAVVVTGQQPGLYGGPLYTAYKIATAIRLADERSNLGLPSVPVFWNASEDHDLAEADRLYVLTADRQSTQLAHCGLSPSGSLDQTIFTDDAVRRLRNLFTAQEDQKLLFEHPKPGETLGTWFTRFLRNRFYGSGLLILEPVSFASEAMEFLIRILESEPKITTRITEHHRYLSSLGLSPVLDLPNAEMSHLFERGAGFRTRLRRKDERINFRGNTLTLSEFIKDLRREPTILSSSALIRPLTQQYLLPVVAQISGPAELRYLTEVRPLFENFGMLPPLNIERQHMILLSQQQDSWRQVHGLTELRSDLEADLRSQDVPPPSWDLYLNNVTRRLQKISVDIGQDLSDEQVSEELKWLRRGLERLIHELPERFQKRHLELVKREIQARRRFFESVFPCGRAQERTLSLASFVAWQPRAITARILDSCEPLPKSRIKYTVLKDEDRWV